LAVSQNIFTAKDAEPLHQAKTWARREPPGAKGMGLYRRSARMSVDWDEEEGASESLDADTPLASLKTHQHRAKLPAQVGQSYRFCWAGLFM